ncbi:MAG: PepSY domain-containing protein [Negativicutes bacterium]
MKTYSKLLAAVLAAGSIALTAGTAAAAIEASQAEAIVMEEYPSAQIISTELDTEDGVQVYEVEFSTNDIRKGKLTIAQEDGKIMECELKYR